MWFRNKEDEKTVRIREDYEKYKDLIPVNDATDFRTIVNRHEDGKVIITFQIPGYDNVVMMVCSDNAKILRDQIEEVLK